jgi:hypothetical protein
MPESSKESPFQRWGSSLCGRIPEQSFWFVPTHAGVRASENVYELVGLRYPLRLLTAELRDLERLGRGTRHPNRRELGDELFPEFATAREYEVVFGQWLHVSPRVCSLTKIG